MNKLLLGCGLLLCSFTVAPDGPWFSGKIVYKNSFATLTGQDITDKIAPVMGSQNLYYINGENYKSYTEKKQLLELYTAKTNEMQYFINGQKSVIDAAANAPAAVVKPLTEKATIAGYACQSLQIDADGNTTVYYYSPKLRVNPELYSKHLAGNWYAFLKASKGALPLKFTMTDRKQGFVMNCEATSIEAMALPLSEFTPEAPAR
ncbi:hypothetical protein [Hymenobacter armeniacus]|uniref:DUF4412 domain-containing protein n=1 Tax=Hymenobacter armeniacus TaxID=2771358 RepID=A0ABR8JR19_9BACT|nr:hypothetical protein [Hymenobacter armeniacus]MBD2721007.1 hypothetical protein [Hymenobacter armeniacus]